MTPQLVAEISIIVSLIQGGDITLVPSPGFDSPAVRTWLERRTAALIAELNKANKQFEVAAGVRARAFLAES